MWSVFKCLRFWCSHWKRIIFKTHRFQIYAFLLASSRSSVSTAEQCERKAKTDKFCFVFIWKRSSVKGGLRFQTYRSLHADSIGSLNRNEIPPLVECAGQQLKACRKSRVVRRLEKPDLIGGRNLYRSLLVWLVDKHLQGMLVIIRYILQAVRTHN